MQFFNSFRIPLGLLYISVCFVKKNKLSHIMKKPYFKWKQHGTEEIKDNGTN